MSRLQKSCQAPSCCCKPVAAIDVINRLLQALGWRPADLGMSALFAICSNTNSSIGNTTKMDKLQALAGVLSSALQLLTQVYTYACRCVKDSDKHCKFSVSMLSAQTHRRCQVATALWFDHPMLESSGVGATISCTARCIRSVLSHFSLRIISYITHRHQA